MQEDSWGLLVNIAEMVEKKKSWMPGVVVFNLSSLEAEFQANLAGTNRSRLGQLHSEVLSQNKQKPNMDSFWV